LVRRLALVAVLSAAVVALPAAPSAAAVRAAPSGDAFYTPPKPLPGKAHGDAIWARKDTGDSTLTNAKVNQLILYRSTSVRGKPIAVSGAIHIPKGKAPKGGWPVITYAHGSTGVADRCAPTRDSGSDIVRLYSTYIEPVLESWLAAGYAVVRTDYEGLGTKGVHPYLVGRSEGRGVLDIVRAARQAQKSLGDRVVIAGHSQGGHAALWAAALAPKWTPELKVRGGVAFAPASHLGETLPALEGSTQPSPLTAYLAIGGAGLDAADPGLKLKSLMSDKALALFPQTNSRCLPELQTSDSFGGLAGSEFFRDGANLDDVHRAVSANDPEELTGIAAPLLVAQGTADTTVLKSLTDLLVDDLRDNGTKVKYLTYEKVGHADIPGASNKDAKAFIAKRLK
jgi:pimeloyl-ACP methyl ester carboxylesterase